MRTCAVAILAALLASAGFGQTCSANERFCVYREWIDDREDLTVLLTVTDRVFTREQTVGRFVLPRTDPQNLLLVSDDGRFLVFGYLDPSAGVTIRHSDGTLVATIAASALLTKHDLALLNWAYPEWSLENDRLVLSLFRSPSASIDSREKIEIDLRDGRLLTSKRDLIEPLLPIIRPLSAKGQNAWGEPRCIENAPVTFDTPGLRTIDSAIFLSNAVETPLIEYPAIARRARISGFVRVEAVVDERGVVTCVRATRLPFGLSDTAQEAVLRWQFRRIRTGATIAPVRGTFELVYELGRAGPVLTIQ